MYKLTWRPRNQEHTTHYFDSAEQLIDWVWNEVKGNWRFISFKIEQLIDNEWQEPQEPKPQLRII